MANLRQCGVFTSLLLISLLSLHDAVRLDLTELRNKVAKIKVNPRGSLWATGHFMGKKSLMDEPAVPLKQKTKLVDPLEDDLPEEERSAFLQQLRVALRARLDTQDCRSSIQELELLMKILERFKADRDAEGESLEHMDT